MNLPPPFGPPACEQCGGEMQACGGLWICSACGNNTEPERGPSVFVGVVRGPGGGVMEESFMVTREQLLEGIAWMRCPECFGDPRGYRMPDGSFSSPPCVKCRGRHVVPVMV